jgi:hypothetical protein
MSATERLRRMREIGEYVYARKAEIRAGNSATRARLRDQLAESEADLDPVDRLSVDDALAVNPELAEAVAKGEAAELAVCESLDEMRRAIEELVVTHDTDPGTEGTQQQ